MNRRCIRSFKPDQVPLDDVLTIVEAGKYAANAFNRQPWHFTIIQNEDVLDEIISENIQAMMSTGDPIFIKNAQTEGYHNFYHAPTVIIVSGLKTSQYMVIDTANAMQNMAVAAQSLGIDSCYVLSFRFAFEGPSGEVLRKKIEMPDGYAPQLALCLGYRDVEKPAAGVRKQDCVNLIL
jgi:nitroreductase